MKSLRSLVVLFWRAPLRKQDEHDQTPLLGRRSVPANLQACSVARPPPRQERSVTLRTPTSRRGCLSRSAPLEMRPRTLIIPCSTLAYKSVYADGRWHRALNDYRVVLGSILWVARTGSSLREMPEEFGKWETAYRRHELWVKQGLLRALGEEHSLGPATKRSK
jgi:transposase